MVELDCADHLIEEFEFIYSLENDLLRKSKIKMPKLVRVINIKMIGTIQFIKA